MAVKLPAALGDHGNKLFVKVDVLFPGVRNVRHVCLSERAKWMDPRERIREDRSKVPKFERRDFRPKTEPC